MTHRITSMAVAVAWVGSAALGCDYEHLCPEAASGWESRELTVDEMRAAVAPYSSSLARKIERNGGWCEGVPIGLDARNGRPVFIRMHCDDSCPEAALFLVTYDPDVPKGEPCQAEGFCSLISGGAMSPLFCMPYSQGYCRCGSEGNCNWNGVCEPENLEDPTRCPIECPCGAAGSGAPLDWVATGFDLPRSPDDASDLAYHSRTGPTNTVSRYLAAWQAVVGDVDGAELALTEAARRGNLPWLLRWESDGPGDDYIALRLQLGPPQVQPLRQDGSDVLTVAHPFEGGAVLCGRDRLNEDLEISGFGRSPRGVLSLPLPGLWRTPLPLEQAWVWVLRDGSDRVDARVGGALPASAVETHLLPALAADLNARITEGGPEADRIAAALDGTCDPALCPEVTPGQGECAATSPPVITPTELRCHPAFFEALQPDYDLDGDWTPNALWFGFGVQPMVPVRLVEP